MNPWLESPRFKQTRGRVTFVYRFISENTPPIALRLKVEINTREHVAVGGYVCISYEVNSRWFQGTCQITTYDLNELLATKLRALYQRSKGRDLFDLAVALDDPRTDIDTIVNIFSAYMDRGDHHVTRMQFEENLAAKRIDRNFVADIGPLLSPDYESDFDAMTDRVLTTLVARLGE